MNAQSKTACLGAGRPSVRHKLLNFILRPRIPWFVRMRFPRLAGLMKFGKANPNTRAYWDKRWRQGTYPEQKFEQLRQAILQAVPLGSTVLDAGCGSGTLMEMLRDQRSCKCVGVDVSAESVAINRAKGLPCYRTKLPALPAVVKQMVFDVCTITETLEHLSSPGDTVMSLREVLRPGGLLVATTPDMSDPDAWGDSWEHINQFTPDSLTSLFGRMFRVETCGAVGLYLLVLARRADTVLAPLRWKGAY